MIGRILWIAAIAAVATVTAFVQLDRQSRVSPELAETVPGPFRAFAQQSVAVNALQSGDPQEALEEAQLLVARRPIPAEHLRFLAAAQFQAGKAEEAGVSIQLAAKRGWRDRLSQEAVLRFALEAGDQPEAARRYAALFVNTYTPNDVLLELGPAVLGSQSDDGRDTFAAIVAGSDRWLKSFLTRGARVLPPDAFVEIISKSQKRGAIFECGDLRKTADSLAKRDEDAAAELRNTAANRC